MWIAREDVLSCSAGTTTQAHRLSSQPAAALAACVVPLPAHFTMVESISAGCFISHMLAATSWASFCKHYEGFAVMKQLQLPQEPPLS